MSKKEQEIINKIANSKEVQDQVKKAFLDFLVFGRGEMTYEFHADGVKEVEECPFCPPKDPCNEPHCPYTKDEE